MVSVSETIPQQTKEKVIDHSKLKGYAPEKTHTWNPFKKYPHNLACYCGSGKKFKKCHANNIPETIPKVQEKEVKAYLERMVKYVSLLKSKGITYKVEERKDEKV